MSAKDQDKYILRFPDGMRERIKNAAKDNGRSMNAEIVQRLEDSFVAAQTIQSTTQQLSDYQQTFNDYVSEFSGFRKELEKHANELIQMVEARDQKISDLENQLRQAHGNVKFHKAKHDAIAEAYDNMVSRLPPPNVIPWVDDDSCYTDPKTGEKVQLPKRDFQRTGMRETVDKQKMLDKIDNLKADPEDPK